MSNEPNPPSPAPKPRWLKAIVARPVRATIAFLILIVLTVLGVRTAAFALGEKLYKSTARIGVKDGSYDPANPWMVIVEWGQTIPEELRSSLIAERAQFRMRTLHPSMQLKSCEMEARNIPNTFIFVVSATAKNATYAQTYLDAVIDAFVALRKEETKEYSDRMIGDMQRSLAGIGEELARLEDQFKASQQEESISKSLGEKKTELQREKAKGEENLAKVQASLRGTQVDITILERACPAEMVIPKFTFLRLL